MYWITEHLCKEAVDDFLNRPLPLFPNPTNPLLFIFRSKTDDFQSSPPIPLTKYNSSIIFESHSPNGFTRSSEFTQESARLEIPYFCSSVISA